MKITDNTDSGAFTALEIEQANARHDRDYGCTREWAKLCSAFVHNERCVWPVAASQRRWNEIVSTLRPYFSLIRMPSLVISNLTSFPSIRMTRRPNTFLIRFFRVCWRRSIRVLPTHCAGELFYGVFDRGPIRLSCACPAHLWVFPYRF